MASPELLWFNERASSWLIRTYIPLIERDIWEILQVLEYVWYYHERVDVIIYVLGNVLLRTLLLYRWMELTLCLAWAAGMRAHVLLYHPDGNVDVNPEDEDEWWDWWTS
jgi:hypothetical protein